MYYIATFAKNVIISLTCFHDILMMLSFLRVCMLCCQFNTCIQLCECAIFFCFMQLTNYVYAHFSNCFTMMDDWSQRWIIAKCFVGWMDESSSIFSSATNTSRVVMCILRSKPHIMYNCLCFLGNRHWNSRQGAHALTNQVRCICWY